jgi:hypothetical protein
MILSRGYVRLFAAMTREGVDAFADQVFAEAVRQGMLIAEHILVAADGGFGSGRSRGIVFRERRSGWIFTARMSICGRRLANFTVQERRRRGLG